MSYPLSRILPWIEITLGLLFLAPYFYKQALRAAFFFILSFMAANSYSLATGDTSYCHCFGELFYLSHWQSLMIDGFMLIMIVLCHFSVTVRKNTSNQKLIPATVRSFALVIILLFSTFPAAAQATGAESSGQTHHPVMELTPEQLREWDKLYEQNPVFESGYRILETLAMEQDSQPESYNLLEHLQYTPEQRDQGSAGNCWVWAGTGIMETALDTKKSILDRLSIQYFDSNYSGGSGSGWAGCGGNLEYFTDFYNSHQPYVVIPWSNTNASYQDGAQSGCPGSAAVSASAITTTPSYAISGEIHVQNITTTGVSQTTAIDNIKSALIQNQAIYFGFYLPRTADDSQGTNWNDFDAFWETSPESEVWTPTMGCGQIWSSAGGHAVLCVGYDDSDSSWIMLNSWGTTSHRPNGLFRITQNLDYGCTFNYGSLHNAYKWQTLSNIYDTAVPTISTETASNITSHSADLNCTLSDLGAASPVEVAFQWGMESGQYLQETPAIPATQTGPYGYNLTDLNEDTVYYFRAKATGPGEGGNSGYGEEKSFTTAIDAPMVKTKDATNGRILGDLKRQAGITGTDYDFSVSFDYGPTKAMEVRRRDRS